MRISLHIRRPARSANGKRAPVVQGKRAYRARRARKAGLAASPCARRLPRVRPACCRYRLRRECRVRRSAIRRLHLGGACLHQRGRLVVRGPEGRARRPRTRMETALRAPSEWSSPLRLVANGFGRRRSASLVPLLRTQAQPPGPARPVDKARDLDWLDQRYRRRALLEWAGFPAAGARLHLAGTWSRFDRRTAHLVEAFGQRRPVSLRLSADYEHRSDRR